MDAQVNWLAIVLATVASMVVGFVWYAKPVFGEVWGKLVGLDEKKMQQGAGIAIIQALVASFVTAYVLAHITYLSYVFFQDTYIEAALATSFWVWLGFSATTIVTHNAFEQRRKKLTLLTLGNQLATLLVMGFIIGWLKP